MMAYYTTTTLHDTDGLHGAHTVITYSASLDAAKADGAAHAKLHGADVIVKTVAAKLMTQANG